jgi:hypothetical protein
MRPTSQTVRLMILGVMLLFAGAAIAQEVHYNYDQTVNFSKYKTYKWVNIEGATYPDQLTDKNIRAAIDAELAKKGLVPKAADPVDLFVGYQTTLDKEKEITSFGGAWRFGGGMATTSTINIGTLMVDMYDPAMKQLVWRGSATETLDPSKDPEKNREKLAKGVAKLLKGSPPPRK